MHYSKERLAALKAELSAEADKLMTIGVLEVEDDDAGPMKALLEKNPGVVKILSEEDQGFREKMLRVSGVLMASVVLQKTGHVTSRNAN